MFIGDPHCLYYSTVVYPQSKVINTYVRNIEFKNLGLSYFLYHGRLNATKKSWERNRYRTLLEPGTLKAARLLTGCLKHGEYKLTKA